MSLQELKKDHAGNVITHPVKGWTTGPVARMAVLLAVNCVESDEELASGGGKSVQLILTPQQALELSETLTKHAKGIMPAIGPGTKRQ